MAEKTLMQAMRCVAAGGQKVTHSTGASTATTNAAPIGVNHFCIVSEQDCWMEVGDPTNNPATADTSKIIAGDKLERYFKITQGQKVMLRSKTTGGDAFIHWMTL